MKKCFILNKPFEGSYADENGNIAHEIIDFFLTDNGEHYIYNNPLGQCSSDYCTDQNSKDGKYLVQYMFLASSARINSDGSSTFKLKYMAEIEEIVHHGSTGKSLIDSQKEVKKYIREHDVTYNKKYLDEIYGDDDGSLYLTFKVKKFYRASTPIEVTTRGYKFQRNKGYIHSDTQKEAYEDLEKTIKSPNWVPVKLKSLDAEKYNNTFNVPTFLDLIMKNDSEECFTNMFYHVLSYKNLLNEFVKEFKPNGINFVDNHYYVKREMTIEGSNKIKGGRTDICAIEENDKQRVVIENKVFSGLNGVNDNGDTQLTVYYNWASQSNNPICFVICPDFRIAEIKAEVEQPMSDKYTFVGYSEIVNFLKKRQSQVSTDFIFYKLYDDIIESFKRYSYKDKAELFEQLFLRATI